MDRITCLFSLINCISFLVNIFTKIDFTFKDLKCYSIEKEETAKSLVTLSKTLFALTKYKAKKGNKYKEQKSSFQTQEQFILTFL